MSDLNNPLETPPIDRPDWPRREPGTYPILVGVQFDATGEHAIKHALAIAAAQRKAEIHVAYVIADKSESARGAVVERHLKQLEAEPAHLNEFVQKHAGAQADAVRQHVRMGDPVETLLQLALDYDAEVIVVGTHGRTGLKKLVFGSVAQKLVEAARCPVLIATPRDFSGMNKTLIPDPVCPDCEAARKASAGANMWCEYHARPHVHPHGVSTSAAGGGTSGHNPSVIPPSGD